jgi:sialic acid synthase SpsE
VVEDVKSGEKLNLKNVKALRPALGEHPSVLSEMIGKTFSQDFEAGTPLRNNMVQSE